MKLSMGQWPVVLLLSASLAAMAQEAPPNEAVRILIEQLGDDDFQKREQAEERLTEMGSAVLAALRIAAQSKDTEIAFRAKRAMRRITTLSIAEQEDLRKQGQAAFYAADYDAMARAYRRLVQADNASIDDGRWLGHAYQLDSRWKEAAAAYSAVIDRMDPLLDRGPGEGTPGGPNSTDWPNTTVNALQERAAIILLTARIQRFCLADPVAAEKTLRRIYHYSDVFNEPLDDIAKKWQARIAEAMATETDIDSAGLDIRLSQSLHFPMMALRDLAAVQRVNGHHPDALETWRRIHLTTRQYIGFKESIDAAAINGLIQDLPDAAEAIVPAVTFLDDDHPSAEFDLGDPATLVKSYDIQQNYWSFALSAAKPHEFESLEFTCDIEQIELRYGGQFNCWGLAGEHSNRKDIGSIGWPNEKETGREKITQKFAIEPGTGLVHFRAGNWKDKFKVHGVQVTATFRPRASDDADAPKPIPGFMFHTEFLPQDGSITLNGEAYRNESTTHNMKPGKHSLEYAHPALPQPRQFALDLQPGARYALFVNLDSPLTSELTNLRGLDSLYGPSTNVVKMPDGRWLVAWCHDGLRFATSDDLVKWSEPSATSDAALFNQNYTCLMPTLYVDKMGTAWVAYFSNQLDIDQLNTGGYRLFLRHSQDGREWSAARPMKMSLSGWPPGKVQMLDGPDGKVWMLYRMQSAVADSPADFSEFKDLEIPASGVQRSHARNPQATIDAAGQIHLVWDHFGQTLYYSRRDADGKWREAIEIAKHEEGQMLSYPQLVMRDDRLALIYNSHQGAFLRRGSCKDGTPTFGDPIKIASHTAPLISATPLMTSDDRIVFLCGQDTVWKQSGSIEALLGESKD